VAIPSHVLDVIKEEKIGLKFNTTIARSNGAHEAECTAIRGNIKIDDWRTVHDFVITDKLRQALTQYWVTS
jgi:hypothetical protein